MFLSIIFVIFFITRFYFQVDIPEHKLQILAGFKTTINQFEDNLMMVTELAHKVRRFKKKTCLIYK